MVEIVVSFWGPAYFQELLLLVSGRVLGTSKIGLVPISSLELIVGFEHVTRWDSPNVQRSALHPGEYAGTQPCNSVVIGITPEGPISKYRGCRCF